MGHEVQIVQFSDGLLPSLDLLSTSASLKGVVKVKPEGFLSSEYVHLFSMMFWMCRKTVRTFVKMGEETTRYQDGSNLLANMELPHVTSVGPEDTAHSTRLPVVIAEEAASRAEVESTEETEHNMSTEETTVRHDSESTAGDPKFWAEINLKDER